MTTTTALDPASTAAPTGRLPSRLASLSGLGFVVLFLVGVAASSPPSDSASGASWIANYRGGADRAGHVTTGVCLVLAGLCLVSFLTGLWTRIAASSNAERISPLPIVAAGVAAACMAVGGLLMGAAITVVKGSIAPDAALLRFCNDMGFAMVGIGAMLAASLSVIVLTFQGRAAGLFGQKLTVLGIVVSLVLLASIAFIPIIALLVWVVVVVIATHRRPAAA